MSEQVDPATLAAELAGRLGKAERPEAIIQRSLIDTVISLPPNIDTPYVTIKSGADIIKEPILTVEQAVTNYCNIRNARHDLWYRKLHKSRMIKWDTAETEATFGQFMDDVLKFTNYNKSHNNMTPDFMLATKDEIVIGDVTVTSTYNLAKQRKYEKYSPLRDILSETNRQVHQVDFILKEDLSNLYQELRKLSERGIISKNVDYSLEIAYCKAATELMVAIKDLCENRNAFNKSLESGKLTKGRINYSILEGLLRDEVSNTYLKPYIPHVREQELYDIVKKEVERIGGADYFKDSMKGVDEAFDTVINNNKNKEQISPKSTLKVVDNSHSYNDKVAHELIKDYITDLVQSDESDIRGYILELLPSFNQLKLMKKIHDDKMSNKDIKDSVEMKDNRVGGEYQYKRKTSGTNPLTQLLETKLKKGKGANRNEKKKPKVINMHSIDAYANSIDDTINYYGSLTTKPPILDDSWDSYNKLEEESTIREREVYDYCRKTNGAQLCNSLSALYNRITHMGIRMGTYDNIFIPPNGSFICIMPKNHAPVTHRTCDMPFIFIARSRLDEPLNHVEDHHRVNTTKYTYYVSKLSRLNVAKISCWDNAGHRLVASSSYIISKCDALREHKAKVVGLLTYLIIDIHQKISEYLDLLKYISFMPFADLHVLPKLILDKCDLLMKTKMDAWMLRQIRRYIKELSNINKLEATKPVMQLQNGVVLQDSLGLKMKLPSFFALSVRHNDPTEFIEEIGIIFASRPKHLYGSQFLDASTTMTARWDVEYDKEVEKYGSWCTTGFSETDYPFQAKYSYHSDAIYYATQLLEQNIDATEGMIESHLFKSSYGDFLHANCSLRGCTKDSKERKTQDDLHTTSIDACLKHYKELNFSDDACRTISVGQNFCVSDEIMEFSMSEKDQRGGGRPIATPTLKTKAALMLIEKPEASIGVFTPNNILVAGKSKIREQHQTYTTAISHGASIGLQNVYQLTEDQSKYSENDNPRKYEVYLRSSNIFKQDIRKLQLVALRKLYDRRHLVHRMPNEIDKDSELLVKKVSNENTRGVRASIGWPQGMLNNISTTIHSAADYWILKAFKNSYPNIQIHARGLVHSDDSWVTVCTNSLEDFVLFTVYRLVAKKLFCLKINEKKLWGGKYLGELVSNYNLNGKVHLATSKVLSNGLSNLTYQNWPIDVSTQISTIQQVYRTGANIGTLIMLSTILRQQIISAYQVTGIQKELLYSLPVELGGYPKCSVFKLGVGGVNAVYDELANKYGENPDADYTKIVLGAVASTRQFFLTNSSNTLNADKDYAEVVMPSRGEIFKGIRYLMPKSKKLHTALKMIDEVTSQFPSDGLGMIITRPLTLAESLGHLKDTTMTSMYRLAAEKYTQSVRRLASSQAQQSSGRVVRVSTSEPMTMNCMYEYLKNIKCTVEDLEMTRAAMEPESEIIHACSAIVHTACIGSDIFPLRGNVINRMPEFETIYDTVSPLVDVMLYMIDSEEPVKSGTPTLYERYGTYKTSIGTLESDARNMRARFDKYFKFYTMAKACSLIMQCKINAVKERSWVQPKIQAETLGGFLKGLYGVSLKKGVRYTIDANIPVSKLHNYSGTLVKSIYTTSVINRIYSNNFPIESIKGRSVQEAMNDIDHSRLDRNDKLKLAILRHELFNERDLLDNIYEADQFSYKWIRTQEYYEGRYRGDWEVAFRIGTLSGNIKRSVGRVRITLTNMNLFLLLKAMRLIAERCFNKTYEYDTAWWLCPIWRQSEAPYVDTYKYYLQHHGYFETTISPNYDEASIGIELKPEAIYHTHVAKLKPDRYVIDDILRTVSVEFDYMVESEQRFRMGSVFQDLTIPMREDIVLKPIYIQGFLNRTIFQEKILEDMILSRRVSAPPNRIEALLQQTIGINKLNPVWQLFYNIYSKLHDSPVVVKEEMKTRDIIETTYECVPMSMQDMCDYHETVEVEKLENVVVEYESVSVRGQKKLKYVPDILKALCSQTWGVLTERNKLDFVYKVITHPGIVEILDSQKMDDVKEMDKELPALTAYFHVSENLHTFAVGAGFNTDEFWSSVARQNLLDIKKKPAPFHGEDELLHEFSELLRDIFGLDPYVEDKDEFRGLK